MIDVYALRRYWIEKLGHCATCMRQALTAALIADAVFAIAALAGFPPAAIAITGFVAVALSALWLAHVVVFTKRAGANRPGLAGRRAALGAMLRAAGVGVAFSIPVATWSTAAMAFCGQCTKNEDCGPCCKCVNTAPVNSGRVCNECKSK